MYSTEDSIKQINKYFGTSYTYKVEIPEFGLNKPIPVFKPSIYRSDELMRLVWRIQEEGYIVNIQDLNTIDKSPDFRIWFNRKSDMLECYFGQIAQSSAPGYLEGTTLEYCLIYAIGEWCKYNKQLKSKLEWDGNNGYMVNFYTNEKTLLFRIHKSNHTFTNQKTELEYVDYLDKPIIVNLGVVSQLSARGQALHIMYSNVKRLVDNPKRYDLSQY